MDEATLKLVVDLQLDDIIRLLSEQKGRVTEGHSDDQSVALNLYKNGLSSYATSVTDHGFALRVSNDDESDEEIVGDNNVQEHQLQGSVQPQQVAQPQQINQPQGAIQTQQGAQPAKSAENDETVIKKPSTIISNTHIISEELPPNNTQSVEPEDKETPTALAPGPAESSTTAKHRCVICQDLYGKKELVSAPQCEHEYCRGCLNDLFGSSFQNEPKFPPRCCDQPFQVEDVSPYLDEHVLLTYSEKEVEFSTRNRVYCSTKSCSAFIPPSQIKAGIATCSKCDAETCSFCKSPMHPQGCQSDPAYRSLVEIARTNFWQTCQSCQRMIELRGGCFHVVCPCGEEFCYVCSKEWGTCNCSPIIERATEMVDEDQDFYTPFGELDRQVRVLKAIQTLEKMDTCTHDYWEHVHGAYKCHDCSHYMPKFAFSCGECTAKYCYRCKKKNGDQWWVLK